MAVRVSCPNCDVTLSLADAPRGSVRVTCKKCRTAFTVGNNTRRPRNDRHNADRNNGDRRQTSAAFWWLIGGGAVALAVAVTIVLVIVLAKGQSPEEKALADAQKELEKLAKDASKDLADKFKDLAGKFPKDLGDMFPKDALNKDQKDGGPRDKYVDDKDKLPPPKEPITVKLEGGIRHLALSSDGKRVAVAWKKLYEHGLNVYEWPGLAPVQKWKKEVGGERGLAFAADNNTLYAVAPDFFAGRVDGYDVATGKEIGTLINSKSMMTLVAVAPAGKLVVAGNKTEIKAWNPATGADLKSLAPTDGPKVTLPLREARFTPDGKVLFLLSPNANSGQVRRWDPDSGAETILMKDIPGQVRQLALTKGGDKLAFVYENSRDGGGVRCCDPAGKELWFWKPPVAQSVMWTIALSPDEKHLAVAGNASAIRILSMADGKVLGGFRNPNSQVQNVAFHPDGKLISADDALRIWDLAELRPIDAPKDPIIIVKDGHVKDGYVKDGQDKKNPSDKDATPPGPQVVEHKSAILQQLDYPYCTFQVAGKPVRLERLKETAWIDAKGVPVPENSPRLAVLASPGNTVDLKVRTEAGKQFLLEMRLVRAVSEIPVRPGNFELKGARVKTYGNRHITFTDMAGKEYSAIIDALGFGYDKSGTCLEGTDAARLFKVGNVLDVWLFPEPKRDFSHVSVARLTSGELMTNAELNAPPPEVAKLEKFTGKLRVRDKGGVKSYTLQISVTIDKKKGSTHRALQIEGDPKAFDMTGKTVPWATIFHDNNTLEVTMETRGTIGTVKEARLVSGVVK